MVNFCPSLSFSIKNFNLENEVINKEIYLNVGRSLDSSWIFEGNTMYQREFLYGYNIFPNLKIQAYKNIDDLCEEWEKRSLNHKLRESIWGTPEIVKERLENLIERTGASEIMINSWIYDPQIRINSYELIAKAWFENG